MVKRVVVLMFFNVFDRAGCSLWQTGLFYESFLAYSAICCPQEIFSLSQWEMLES